MANILLSFLAGANPIVGTPFLHRVKNIPDDLKNYSYTDYSMVMPIYFGTMSVAAALLRNCGMSLFMSLLIITIISIIIVLSIVVQYDLYNFTTKKEWYNYIAKVITHHAFAYATIYFILRWLI